MLIRSAEVWRHGLADLRIEDVRIEDGAIAEIGQLFPRPDEQTMDAGGGALLPGLHDHHIHLNALAAKATSVVCGPPEVESAEDLAGVLDRPGTGWLRGVGYHESVMGLPDAAALDRLVMDRPLRLQHRSGRMWLLNSAALAIIADQSPPPGLEHDGRRFTGRLFDGDEWLRGAIGGTPPPLADVSSTLASYGVTGITDMSPRNDVPDAAHFATQVGSGALAQHLVLAGQATLAAAARDGWTLGPTKLHLHEAALPPFDQAVTSIRQSHSGDRPVAIHCVSEVELVFALAALEEAGVVAGDRIEHASVVSPELAGRIAALALHICVQPHFIAERGERYLADVEPRHHGNLYRLHSLAAHGITLAGGSDAPFGGADPWRSMRAAVTRATASGVIIGLNEALTPEVALNLFLRDPLDLTRTREIAQGSRADLCLLDRPWQQASERLLTDDVRACWASGRLIHQRIDQAPPQGLARAEALT